MSTTMNRVLFCYNLFFLAVSIRTTMGLTPAPAPAVAVVAAPAPAVAAPTPALSPPVTAAGTPNVLNILKKAGVYRTLIKLMRSTPVANQVNGELKNVNVGMTILAPTDAAFASLAPGTLNGLTDEEKTILVQFHIIPTFVALSEFQTLTNPVSTKASELRKTTYPFNITTIGNLVSISTGVDNATVSGTVYTDYQLAIYKVDKVLLPLGVFQPQKESSAAVTAQPPPVDTSGGMGLKENALVALVGAALAVLWL